MAYVLGLYAVACLVAWRLSHGLSFTRGSRTALGVVVANVLPLLPSIPLIARLALSPLVLIGSVTATAAAFRQSDREHTDRERAETWTKAGMALAGIAVLEVSLLAVGTFVWLGMQNASF